MSAKDTETSLSDNSIAEVYFGDYERDEYGFRKCDQVVETCKNNDDGGEGEEGKQSKEESVNVSKKRKNNNKLSPGPKKAQKTSENKINLEDVSKVTLRCWINDFTGLEDKFQTIYNEVHHELYDSIAQVHESEGEKWTPIAAILDDLFDEKIDEIEKTLEEKVEKISGVLGEMNRELHKRINK